VSIDNDIENPTPLPGWVASSTGYDVTQAPWNAVSSSADVSALLQEAANAAKEAAYNDKTRRELILNPRKGGYWRIKAGLLLDMGFLIVRGKGAAIDASAMATTQAITLTGTADQLEGGEPWGNGVSGLDHLTIRGPGEKEPEKEPGIYIPVDGLVFSSAGPAGPSHIKNTQLAITKFRHGVRYENNTYCVTQDGGDIWHCEIGIFMTPSVNAGERITHVNQTIHNNDILFYLESGTADLHFDNCSLDYPFKNFGIVAEGCASIDGGHIEGNAIEEWFALGANATARLNISNLSWVLAEEKESHPFGEIPEGCDGIHLDKIKFVFVAPYNRGCLFDGPGPATARAISWGWPDPSAAWMPPISRSLNLVEGQFAAGTAPGWTTAKNVTPHKEGGFGGEGHVTLAVANNGENTEFAEVIPVEPGKAFLSSYRFESAELAAKKLTLLNKITWLRADGSVISEQTLSEIKEENVPAPWTLKKPTSVIVPPQAAQAKIEWLGTAWTTGASVALSDIIINVV
jgi:hypothetical protein